MELDKFPALVISTISRFCRLIRRYRDAQRLLTYDEVSDDSKRDSNHPQSHYHRDVDNMRGIPVSMRTEESLRGKEPEDKKQSRSDERYRRQETS